MHKTILLVASCIACGVAFEQAAGQSGAKPAGAVPECSNASGNHDLDIKNGASVRQGCWHRSFAYGRVSGAPDGLNALDGTIAIDQADASGVETWSASVVAQRLGKGASGNRSALTTSFGLVGRPVAAGDYVSLLANAYATSGAGGGAGPGSGLDQRYKGSLWGVNAHPRLAGGAIAWRGIYGTELNTEIEEGASAYARIGLFVATGENGPKQGAGDDAAIALSNNGPKAAPWKAGIQFGATWGSWPFDSASKLISVQPRILPAASEKILHAGIGLDLGAVAFTEAAIRTPGFQVNPDGTMTVREIPENMVRIPAPGEQTVFVDAADHRWKSKDSAGTIRILTN